jgi:DNA-binding MarR family transcriptional regulator
VPASELDRLIHEPARLRLVTLLYVVDEADFAYVADRTGMTAGNISSHMARLERAGYVEVDKSFVDRRPRTVYRLSAAGRTAVETYRREIGALLSEMDDAGSR